MNKDKITKSMLKERGWTDSLIKNFIPNPHETKPNPQYRSGSPMCLYEIKIVEKIEESKDFCEQMIKVKKRKEAAKKAVETKLNNLKKYMEEIEIEIDCLSKQNLLKESIEHYNERQSEINSDNFASKNSNKDFLERIQVNYIRHCLTNYEEELYETKGRVGVLEGYFCLREKIFNEILKKYPWLKEECKRQM